MKHLREVAAAKRALYGVAKHIQHEHPTDAKLLVTVIKALTRSADRLLGDTQVT